MKPVAHRTFMQYLLRSTYGYIKRRGILHFIPRPESCPKSFQLEVDDLRVTSAITLNCIFQNSSPLLASQTYTCLWLSPNGDCHMQVQPAVVDFELLEPLDLKKCRGIQDRERTDSLRPAEVITTVCRVLDGDRTVFTLTNAGVRLWRSITDRVTLRIIGEWKECESFFKYKARFVKEPRQEYDT